MNNIGDQSGRIIPIAPGPIDSCRGRGRRRIARGLSPRLMYVFPVELTQAVTNVSNSEAVPTIHIIPCASISK
jgi:hypothetical protein